MTKILVIDDDEQMRNVLKKLLTHEGYQVFIAEDGVEGIPTRFEITWIY